MSLGDPWVLRCPLGHAAIEIGRNSYRCQSCGRVFEGEPVDARRVDGFPADQRARLTPVGAGLLVFALGLVYLVALVLINGGGA